MYTRQQNHTRHRCIAARLLLACLLGASVAAPAVEPGNGTAPAAGSGNAAPPPVYRPPLRGAPATRVGGGTRGIDAGAPSLQLLVPDHTALCSDPQPNLYWYVSAPVSARLEFAIINDDDFETLAETALPAVNAPGIQKLALRDQHVTLRAGQDYQWSIALVQDPEQRSSDIVASGALRYQPLDAPQASRMQALAGLNAAAAYAEKGYWYDAVDAVSELIRRQPDHPQLTAWRALLLEQADLDEVVRASP